MKTYHDHCPSVLCDPRRVPGAGFGVLAMRYTPGPWRLLHADQSEDEEDIEDSVWAGEPGKEQHVAVIRIGLRESKGNAHLIAAAPEMLEALKHLRANACQFGDFMYGAVRECSQDMIQVIDAAIRKAEGNG